jgi:hypothetical protein
MSIKTDTEAFWVPLDDDCQDEDEALAELLDETLKTLHLANVAKFMGLNSAVLHNVPDHECSHTQLENVHAHSAASCLTNAMAKVCNKLVCIAVGSSNPGVLVTYKKRLGETLIKQSNRPQLKAFREAVETTTPKAVKGNSAIIAVTPDSVSAEDEESKSVVDSITESEDEVQEDSQASTCEGQEENQPDNRLDAMDGTGLQEGTKPTADPYLVGLHNKEAKQERDGLVAALLQMFHANHSNR